MKGLGDSGSDARGLGRCAGRLETHPDDRSRTHGHRERFAAGGAPRAGGGGGDAPAFPSCPHVADGRDGPRGRAPATGTQLLYHSPRAFVAGNPSRKQGRQYRFKVRARNALGWGEFSPPTAPLVLNTLGKCEPPELEDRGTTWIALRLRAPPGSGPVGGFEVQM